MQPTTKTGGRAPVARQSSTQGSWFASWQVIVSLSVVLIAICTAVVLGFVNEANPILDNGPLPVANAGLQPAADTAACKKLMPAMPEQLGGSKRRTLVGTTDGIAAWGDPPVILRCGLQTPEDLTCSAALIQVNGVSWLQLTEQGLSQTTYIAADRSVRIAVTIPDGSGTGPIQQISDVVAATLPARQPCRDGVLLPTDTN